MTKLFEIPVTKMSGETGTLAEYRGKVMLIVNTASQCGLTPQYDGLEKLYRRFRADGLEVLGFPANDFKGQEPGSNEEIAAFCKGSFGVEFPMFQKITVTGEATHSLYKTLIAERPERVVKEPGKFLARLQGHGIETNPEPGVLWNFEKFLVGRDGRVVERFSPEIVPDDPLVVAAVEAALRS